MAGKNEMTFTGHLEELRRKIITVLVFFVLSFIISFIFVDRVVIFLKEPLTEISINLYYFKPFEKFMTYLRISFYMGLFVSIPFGVIQVWDFINPAFDRKERRKLSVILAAVPVMFLIGAVFAYTVAAPSALKFFAGYSAGDNIVPMWSFGEYIELLAGFFIVCGLIFEMPLLLVLLIRLGIVKTKFLAKYRKHIILVIAVFAGIFSPPDVVSQLIIGIPMYLMFELSVAIGKVIEKS